jgi:hypothetical protein
MHNFLLEIPACILSILFHAIISGNKNKSKAMSKIAAVQGSIE